MTPQQAKTELSDRVLWYDGLSSYTPASMLKQLLTRPVYFVTELTPSVVHYNDIAAVPARVRSSCELPTPQWDNELLTMSDEAFVARLGSLHRKYTAMHPDSAECATTRLHAELRLLAECGWINLAKVITKCLDTLRHEGVVWGLGRGSVTNSYLFFLIGAHGVDPIMYELPYDELEVAMRGTPTLSLLGILVNIDQ